MAALFKKEILQDSSEDLLGGETSSSHWRQRLKLALFQVFLQYYEDEDSLEAHRNSLSVAVYTVLSRVLVLAQLLSLLLTAQTDKVTWREFHWGLQTLAYSRPDYVAANMGVFSGFFYASAGIVLGAAAALLLMLLRALLGMDPNRFFLKHGFAWLLTYLRGVGLIPTFSSLLAAVKYSAVDEGASEYLDCDARLFNTSASGSALGTLGLVCCSVVLLHTTLVYEQSLVRAKWSLRAKAHSLVDVIVHLVLFILVALIFAGEFHAGLRRRMLSVLVSLASLLASSFNLYYLPYYRLEQNVLWPGIFNVFVLAAVVMALEETYQSPAAVVTIMLFVSPMVVLLTKEIVRVRWQYICAQYPRDFSKLSSHFQVELGLREWVSLVASGSKGPQGSIAAAFNVSTGRFLAKMLCVWETNFYLTAVRDLRLAMLKITKAQLCAESLEADFRIFCFAQVLERQHKRYEELEYLTFWGVLEEAKALDRKSCHMLAALWSELSLAKPRYRSLSRLAQEVSQSLRHCVDKAKCALTYARTNRQALMLLGSLLKDILNDPRGDEYLSKILTKDTAEKGYFSEDGAVIVASGQHSKLGLILFVSEKAKEVLEIKDLREVIGASMTSIIPDPWAKRHTSLMLKFLLYASSSCVEHTILHLCKSSGFLIEVLAQIRVSYLHGNAYILLAFLPRGHTREVILLGKDLQVLGHTEAVPAMLGLPAGLYIGMTVKALFPHLRTPLDAQPFDEVFEYRNYATQKVLKVRLVAEQYAREQVQCLHILSEEEETQILGVRVAHRVQSQMELIQTLTRMELGDVSPHLEKNVGFGAFAEFRVSAKRMKTASFADIEDPALVLKKGDADQKVTVSVTSTSFMVASTYSKSALLRVKSASFRLRAALLCLMLFTVSLSAACCVLLSLAEDKFLDQSFDLILRRGYFAARITTKATQLHWEYSESVKADMMEDIQQYQDVFTTAKDKAGQWRSGPLSHYYRDSEVPVWEFREKEPHMLKRNLLDAMQMYIDHAKSFASAASPHLSDFYYIRRNGLGETFSAINNSSHLHLTATLQETEAAKSKVDIVVLSGEIALLLLFLVVTTPNIALMSRVHAQAWKRLLDLERPTLLKLRNECYSRLEFHHKKTTIVPHPFDPVDSRRRLQSFQYQWIALAVKTSASLLMSLLFLVTLWRALCRPVFDVLLVSPVALARLEGQNQLLQTVLFWAQEGARTDEQETRWPKLQISAQISLENDLRALRDSLRATLDSFRLKEVGTDFLMESVGGTEDLLALGLHCAISVSTLDAAFVGAEGLPSLEAEVTAIQTHLQRGTEAYIQSVHTALRSKVVYSILSSVAYTVASLALFVFFYAPMVFSFHKQVSQVWKLFRIVPKAEIRLASQLA